MPIITLPKKIKKNDDLVAIPRKEYEYLIALRKTHPILTQETMAEKDIFRLSREAKKLKTIGKLPLLRSLRSLR